MTQAFYAHMNKKKEPALLTYFAYVLARFAFLCCKLGYPEID
jgi:hypothetical protein